MKKTTVGLLCLCLISNGLLAACSKKSADQDQPVQNAENKDNAQDNANADIAAAAEETDVQKAEPEKEQAKDDTRNDTAVKRAHPRHDYQVLKPKTPGLDQNPILKEIPGDSFLILASSGNFKFEREDVGDFFKHISTLMQDQIKALPEDSPFLKATRAFAHAIFKTFSPEKLTSLGIAGDTSPQFALYFVRQTPVLRIAMSDAEKFRGIIESYWEQNNVETHRADNVSSHWILVPIEENSSTELALRWDSDRLTITMISSMEHAGFLLPDIALIPDEDHSAYQKLSGLDTDENAAVIGIFDDNAMLNQFAALQEQYKKLADQSRNPVNNQCLKDFRRIADNIPRVIIQMFVVTGGSSAGIDVKLSLDVKMTDWLKELSAWKPQNIAHPTTSEMPVAQFYTALPMQTLLKGINAIHESVHKERFECSSLDFLNEIEIPEEVKEFDLAHDHFIGYTVYESNDDSEPTSYAATWETQNIALLAETLGILESESLKKSMADGTEENGEPRQESAHESEVIADAKLNLDEDAKDLFPSPNYQVKTNRIAIASDKKLLESLSDKPLKATASLIHVSFSERLDEDLADADDDRDYVVNAKLSTTEKTVDIVLRYAIE